MEYKSSNNSIEKESIGNKKTLQIHKQYSHESETFENSINKNDNSIEELNTNLKKTIGFFSKKIYIEKPESENINRKYTLDEHIKIKNFVPIIKPININIVPSKLILNKKGFKDLKYNQNNKLLLMNNNYFMSCPNSEEDEESDIYISDSNYDKIKGTRKLLKNIRNKNILSKSVFISKCKIYKDEMKISSDSDNDSINFEDDNNLLYDDNDFINYNLNSDEENNNKNEVAHTSRKNRFNSCSILEVLKNKLSFDELI